MLSGGTGTDTSGTRTGTEGPSMCRTELPPIRLRSGGSTGSTNFAGVVPGKGTSPSTSSHLPQTTRTLNLKAYQERGEQGAPPGRAGEQKMTLRSVDCGLKMSTAGTGSSSSRSRVQQQLYDRSWTGPKPKPAAAVGPFPGSGGAPGATKQQMMANREDRGASGVEYTTTGQEQAALASNGEDGQLQGVGPASWSSTCSPAITSLNRQGASTQFSSSLDLIASSSGDRDIGLPDALEQELIGRAGAASTRHQFPETGGGSSFKIFEVKKGEDEDDKISEILCNAAQPHQDPEAERGRANGRKAQSEEVARVDDSPPPGTEGGTVAPQHAIQSGTARFYGRLGKFS
ncbi:unnamed protein product [Amoebophrya sp. A25]|nr:unnamed protein product [Amoebophrya sp. A25]|eukprot:GSA25T00002535001.1